MNIHEIFATVVLILQIQGGQPIGTATGFFYLKANEVYLVTNRHVVRDEKKEHRPDILRLRMHKSSDEIGPGIDFDVQLYKNHAPLWFVHPNYPNKKIDIAVVKIDQQAEVRPFF